MQIQAVKMLLARSGLGRVRNSELVELLVQASDQVASRPPLCGGILGPYNGEETYKEDQLEECSTYLSRLYLKNMSRCLCLVCCQRSGLREAMKKGWLDYRVEG